MTKANNTLKRPPTEAEMRLAVQRIGLHMDSSQLQRDDDHPALVFENCIDELLMLRQFRADVNAFVERMKIELARR